MVPTFLYWLKLQQQIMQIIIQLNNFSAHENMYYLKQS